MSVSGVIHPAEDDYEDDEEETDEITEWFLTSGPKDSLELHQRECPTREDDRRRCDCIPVTLQRGAIA
jgi:hypothetical protein